MSNNSIELYERLNIDLKMKLNLITNEYDYLANKLILDLQRLKISKDVSVSIVIDVGRGYTCQATSYFRRHRLAAFQVELWKC